MVKKSGSKNDFTFSVGQNVVYPAHGVGTVTGVEKQTVAGMDLEVYVVSFDQDKMILRVPTNRAEASGMRALAGTKLVDDAMKTLGGRARIKRTMWSRRAQEYEAKINSGDLISIAEVVRDLHRGEDQPEQSYSERQLYESALDRMARELAAVENIDRDAAMERLAASLAKKKAAA
ncbi:MAG: CarD family transcriptional regulator [Pseudomonadota bacterium]